MNHFKSSVFALTLGLSALPFSFSTTAIAAGATESITTTDQDLNRPSESDTIKLRDCSNRSGNDKMLCEKDYQTGNPNAMSNDKRNNTLRDDLRSRELNNRNLNNRNLNNNSIDMQSRDNRSRESFPSDTGPGGIGATQPNGSNSMNSTTGEMRPNAPSTNGSGRYDSGPSKAM